MAESDAARYTRPADAIENSTTKMMVNFLAIVAQSGFITPQSCTTAARTAAHSQAKLLYMIECAELDYLLQTLCSQQQM